MATVTRTRLQYYLDELDRISFTGRYGATVVFYADGKQTKHLSVNKDAAAAILVKLIDVLGIDTLATALENLRDGKASVPGRNAAVRKEAS